jgi:hypothetical protein
MSKQSPVNLDKLPEIFVSNKDISSAVSKAVQAGRLRKLASRLYTRNLTEEPESIVKRNWHALLKDYFPDALISDRTALENRPATDGSVFIISSASRDLVLPGMIFKTRSGHPPLDSDRPFLNSLRISSQPRAWLENMRPSRKRGGAVSRTLSKEELEERLDSLLRRGGERALNQLRDEARAVSQELKMAEEFHDLDNLIGTFLGTRNVKLSTDTGKARKQGLPCDPGRIELFMKLFSELRTLAPVTRPVGAMKDSANTNLAFFEAYFSNYIEGTEFLVEEAVDIVFNGVIPEDRPEDAHDVLGTYRIVSDKKEMKRIPRDFESFISLVKKRHAVFMESRSDKRPGEFKAKTNRAGNSVFVEPGLVMGTLAKGFEIYRGLEAPFHRAVFMMFLISEVHPFIDGNGRAARIMMNAELVAQDEQRIIIPTVYRDDYLTALKALTQNEKPMPVIRVLDFAQKYTGSIRWEDFDTARLDLQHTNAFRDSTEAEDHGVRLVLPKNI